MKKDYITICCVILFIIVLILTLLYYKRKVVKQENFKNDRYTNGKCCTEMEIQKCESYGKTGVCNYNENNKSCLCQNALF